jgi:hypothetical protein
MTVPEGASLADTKKQLVLRTFASTSGDANRTAKIVGISPEDVLSEIASLIRTNGAHRDGTGVPASAPAPAATGSARARGAPAKSKVKKR